jgi:hypothetical protein
MRCAEPRFGACAGASGASLNRGFPTTKHPAPSTKGRSDEKGARRRGQDRTVTVAATRRRGLWPLDSSRRIAGRICVLPVDGEVIEGEAIGKNARLSDGKDVLSGGQGKQVSSSTSLLGSSSSLEQKVRKDIKVLLQCSNKPWRIAYATQVGQLRRVRQRTKDTVELPEGPVSRCKWRIPPVPLSNSNP